LYYPIKITIIRVNIDICTYIYIYYKYISNSFTEYLKR